MSLINASATILCSSVACIGAAAQPAGEKPATDQPRIRITRNFAAELNAQIDGVPEEDRAWPLYREAYMKLYRSLLAMDENWPPMPGTETWEASLRDIKQHGEAVELIRRAASRQHFGMRFSDQPEPIISAFLAKESGEEFVEQPAGENPILYEVLMHEVSFLRSITRTILMDCRRAYVENDPEGFLKNCRALVGLARHADSRLGLIATTLSRGIEGAFFDMVGEALWHSPRLLSDAQLVDLQQMIAGMSMQQSAAEGIAEERLYLEDIMQRMYTDNGNGDGVMTPEGWKVYESFAGGLEGPKRASDFIKASIANRAEMLAQFDNIVAETTAFINVPMWEWKTLPDLVPESQVHTPAKRAKYCLIMITMPELGKAVQRAGFAEQTRDATRVVIALQQYHRKHAAYPGTLNDLIPEFLSEVPADLFDGKPLRSTIRDGKPVVYSVGVNRQDDGGSFDPKNLINKSHWRPAAVVTKALRDPATRDTVTAGDWVLWPKPQSP